MRIGVAGWSYADWEGRIHPKPKPRAYHPLDEFQRAFGCVEINSSFYRALNPDLVRGWLDRIQADVDFHFAVKLHRDFTHERERAFETPRALGEGLAAFRSSLGPLLEHPRLGATLLQFPLSFRPTARSKRYLAALLDAASDLRPVVELRHRGWFESGLVRELEARGGSLAVIDLPASEDHPPPGFEGRGPIGYLRLHGRNAKAWFDPKSGRDEQYDYRYSRSELEPLARRAESLAARTDRTYVITNNHFAGSAVADAATLMGLVGQPPDSLPARWSEVFPELSAIAPSRGQTDLYR